jgi:hypothetical protein
MSEYKDTVVRLIRERTGEPLLNGTIDDAAVITQEAFNHATKDVRILSNRLNADCYARESVRNAARTFLATPDHKLRILIESSLWDESNKFEWEKHPFIADLKEHLHGHDGTSGRLEVRLVPKSWAQRYKFNFLILDDYGYRYEADRDSSAAVAKFFPEAEKQKGLQALQTNFDMLWKAYKPIVLH